MSPAAESILCTNEETVIDKSCHVGIESPFVGIRVKLVLVTPDTLAHVELLRLSFGFFFCE